MDVIKSIRKYILAIDGIAVGQRVYQKRLPQGVVTLPAIVTKITSESYEHVLSGLAGMVATRISVECYGATSEAARSVADSVIWSGIDELKEEYEGTNIRSVMVEDGRREYEDEDTTAGDFQRHVCSFDLMVTWRKE